VISAAWRVHVIGWLLLLPAAVLLVAFTHYPVAATIYTSLFSNPKAGRAGVWVGLENYHAMVEDPVFWQAVGNNLWFAVGTNGMLPFSRLIVNAPIRTSATSAIAGPT